MTINISWPRPAGKGRSRSGLTRAVRGRLLRAESAGPGAPPGAGGDRAGRADGSRAPGCPDADAHAAPSSGPGIRGPHRRRAVRRDRAAGPPLARDLLHATTRLGPARGYYYQLISGIGWTSLPRLPKLRQPTLILAGDDDPIIPLVNARIMHRLIPRSELHIYHGGHLELVADAERIAPVVEAFLDAGPAIPESQAMKGDQR
jgi:pimeloyl-ACP methyl ester carboxylesterase